MRYGGLRPASGNGAPACLSKLTRAVTEHKPLKLLCIYREYTKSSMLEASPGFLILPSHAASDADVFVVEKLSDLDRVESVHLVSRSSWRRAL